jgi:hypothetical protein
LGGDDEAEVFGWELGGGGGEEFVCDDLGAGMVCELFVGMHKYKYKYIYSGIIQERTHRTKGFQSG